MTLNGNLAGYAVKGMLALLIGVSGWVITKVDAKVEKHTEKIQLLEITTKQIEIKLDYLIKGVDEIKTDIKRGRML